MVVGARIGVVRRWWLAGVKMTDRSLQEHLCVIAEAPNLASVAVKQSNLKLGPHCPARSSVVGQNLI
ncbi:hypothetical protein V6N11_012724 [Hibiscus sabdariffa]|uniref:Uncharacterized protein n=1 Tax=Hibiscus sabdariffa TaxID=183260 RepID=A0ABR1ZNW3_9ROSI